MYVTFSTTIVFFFTLLLKIHFQTLLFSSKLLYTGKILFKKSLKSQKKRLRCYFGLKGSIIFLITFFGIYKKKIMESFHLPVFTGFARFEIFLLFPEFFCLCVCFIALPEELLHRISQNFILSLTLT